MLLAQARFQWSNARWLHDSVFDAPVMDTRYRLHGMPTFFVFRG